MSPKNNTSNVWQDEATPVQRSTFTKSNEGAPEIREDSHAVPSKTRDQKPLNGFSPVSDKEVFDVEPFDPVLARKMALVNSAIDEIGMTRYQWRMFFLNGFGYAVDSVSISRLTPLLKVEIKQSIF